MRRATPEDVDTAMRAFDEFWQRHGAAHFAVEEQLLLPALPRDDPRCAEGADRMLAEHTAIRRQADALPSAAGDRKVPAVNELGELLTAHVRFEERELFELIEHRLSSRELAALGRAIRAFAQVR